MKISHADYQRVNEAIALMYRRAFEVGASAAIAETLVATFGGVNAVAGALRGSEILSFAATEPTFARVLQRTTPLIARLHPRFFRRELTGNVLLLSDFLSRRDFENGELHGEGWNTLPYQDDLGVNLVLPNGDLVSAALMRERRTFREEDRQMFALLLPHFETLFTPPIAPDATALATLGLTRREQEVLFWITEGKQNAEVAAILGIAPGTVKRHLENLFAKLGVESRHAAARLAFEKIGRRW